MKKSIKKSKSKSKIILNQHTAKLSSFVLIIVAVVAGLVYFIQQSRINNLQTENSNLVFSSVTPNQACLGLKNLPTTVKLDARQTYFNHSSTNLKLFSICNIGGNTSTVTKGADVAEIDKGGLDFGVQVSYFNSSKAAHDFGDKMINPQRYWTVNGDNLTQDVPMWNYFYSVVASGKYAYYDAYAIKGNAYMRMTLPCENKDPGVCGNEALLNLKNLSESISTITNF